MAGFNLGIAGIGVMGPAEGVAVVQQVSAVGQVEGVQGKRPVFSERFAERLPEGGVRTQKARSVDPEKHY